MDLLRLGRLTLNRDWEKKGEEYFKAFSREFTSHPSAFAQSLTALDFALGPSKEIVFAVGKDDQSMDQMLKSLYGRFIPNKVVILRPASDPEVEAIADVAPFVREQRAVQGKTTAYVCQNFHCEFPTTDPLKFERLLDQSK